MRRCRPFTQLIASQSIVSPLVALDNAPSIISSANRRVALSSASVPARNAFDHRPASTRTARPSIARSVHALHLSAAATQHCLELSPPQTESFLPRCEPQSAAALEISLSMIERVENHRLDLLVRQPIGRLLRFQLPCPTAVRAPRHAESRSRRSGTSPQCAAARHLIGGTPFRSKRARDRQSFASCARPEEHESPHSSAHPRPS